MRSLFFILIVVALLTACRRNQTTDTDPYVYIDGSGLAGKWVAQERYWSPGIGGTWYALAPEEWFIIEFKADSSFTYSANFPKADSLFSKYSLAGPRINVSSLVNPKTDYWMYNFNDAGRLELAISLCFEGCPYRLRRIQ